VTPRLTKTLCIFNESLNSLHTSHFFTCSAAAAAAGDSEPSTTQERMASRWAGQGEERVNSIVELMVLLLVAVTLAAAFLAVVGRVRHMYRFRA
jgi:integral membrane sensor domain MASE1